MGNELKRDGIAEIISSYSCDACLRIIPIYWDIDGWTGQNVPVVNNPEMIMTVKEDFDFENVPDSIKSEIDEALDCLSVNAYHGFAALCRRSVQAICDNLGADGSTKVQNQITELLEMMGLDKEWEDMAKQIMLTGHDGAHPQLPEVNLKRASVLISLLQDLTYQLYTRPGKIKEAAKLRKEAIQKGK
ncbi:protein of unknown function [Gracilimonas mengyeensis]|uniref:DUF4145 domain-containing protein n=2 Tax=Gracilimonas mengyeensis TaxID=1302730 RepID=A0A521DWQ1_9BACT|nr:protein of unknown function [Gracilimonas mengyeensis]